MKNLIMFTLVFAVICGCTQSSTETQETQTTDTQNDSFESLDSTAVNSIISKLQGIEKYAVKDNYFTLAKLLAFKEDEKNYQGIIKLIGKKGSGYIEKLDLKNGFIKYSDFQHGDHVISVTYWNKSDKSKLIATVDAFSDGMALESNISFELYQNGNYIVKELNQIIPEIDRAYSIVDAAIPEDLEFYNNFWNLPNSGKNIKYCLENECVELLWNDGVFLLGKQEFNVSQKATKHIDGGLNQFDLASNDLTDQDIANIKAWRVGSTVQGAELTQLYGQEPIESIHNWYGLHESHPDKIEIIEVQEVDDHIYLTYQFEQEEEDYRGKTVCIRLLKNKQWRSELSFKSATDLRLGSSGNSYTFSGKMDYEANPIKLDLKESVISLLFQYLNADYSVLDLPMQHERLRTSTFEIMPRENGFKAEPTGTVELNNFPLEAEAIERIKKDQSAKYYVDQLNKLDDSYEKQKNEMIAYLQRMEKELLGMNKP